MNKKSLFCILSLLILTGGIVVSQENGKAAETGTEAAAKSAEAPATDGTETSGTPEAAAQKSEAAAKSTEASEEKTEGSASGKSSNPALHKPGTADVPDSKRPEKISQDKIDELDRLYPDTRKENSDILKYGMEEDILDLLDKLVKNEDVRFVDDVYELFEQTKNPDVRDKILEYFTNLKDPCLEDYAVMLINDPYDEKKSTVAAAFKYIQACKTECATPAVLKLLENEEDDYFDQALTTIGEIGGSDEAVYLTEYLDREDLTTGQKQSLVKVLGKIKAVETYDALVEMAEDTDENSFVRMYSAEAIGAMEKEEAVDVLVKLYEDNDPKLRSYVIKGLAYFPKNEDAKNTIIQAIRDTHVSVRQEAIEAARKNDFKEAVPFIIFRLEKDKEDTIKKKCFPALASLNTKEGNEYLIRQITDKKVADNPKSRAAAALLEAGNTGTDEIIALTRETLKDDRRKNLRYALGKEFAKYKRSEFADICKDYLNSSDVSTQGTGLDIYAKGRYDSVTPVVRDIIIKGAKDSSKKNANALKAEKILGSQDSAVIEANKIREEAAAAEEAKKKAEADKKAAEAAARKSGGVKKTAPAANEAASSEANAK